MAQKKKIKDTTSKNRHMKTYAELEDGTLVEYNISDGYEDEYGSWHDTLNYEWATEAKKIEASFKKKIVAVVAKIWEQTVNCVTYTKGNNVKIYQQTYTDDKELNYRWECSAPKHMYDSCRVFYTAKPDKYFAYEKSYIQHFGLKTDPYGKILEEKKND
jgi:hypothetical protein